MSDKRQALEEAIRIHITHLASFTEQAQAFAQSVLSTSEALAAETSKLADLHYQEGRSTPEYENYDSDFWRYKDALGNLAEEAEGTAAAIRWLASHVLDLSWLFKDLEDAKVASHV